MKALIAGLGLPDILIARLGEERIERQPAGGSSAGTQGAEWSQLCRGVEASASQLKDIAFKARYAHSAAEREAYVAMMLGPLAALEHLRRQWSGM